MSSRSAWVSACVGSTSVPALSREARRSHCSACAFAVGVKSSTGRPSRASDCAGARPCQLFDPDVVEREACGHVAGTARDPGGRRNAHALDAQARYLVELPSSAAKTAVCCPRVRAEAAPAYCAAVPPPSARFRHKRAVAHDVEARFSTVVTLGLGAGHPGDAAPLTTPDAHGMPAQRRRS